MITRLYVNNFRCLVAFEAQLESFGVLCGPNGAGKSSVFDVLKFIRDLVAGDSYLGGKEEGDIERLEFTNWLASTVQEFELGVTADGHTFEYLLHLEQVSTDLKPRIVRERATYDRRSSSTAIRLASNSKNRAVYRRVFHWTGVKPRSGQYSLLKTDAKSRYSSKQSPTF